MNTCFFPVLQAFPLVQALGFGAPVSAETFFVSPGESIQAAIDAASDGDDVLLSPGVYNQVVDFAGKAVRLASTDGADATILDGTGLDDSVIRCTSGEGLETSIEKLTITGGTGDRPFGPGYSVGGGLVIRESGATVRDCVFVGNSTLTFGGAIFIEGGSAVISGCRFEGNSTTLRGGAIATCDFYEQFCDVSLEISDCLFNGNHTLMGDGGAIRYASEAGAGASIVDCRFLDNRARGFGGAVYVRGNRSTVSRCHFEGNSTPGRAGGLYFSVDGESLIESCDFIDNQGSKAGAMELEDMSGEVRDCRFIGNRGVYWAGAVICWDDVEARFDRCLFSDNTARRGGAVWCFATNHPTFVNTVFHGNRARFGAVFSGALFNSVVLENCTVIQNHASASGALIHHSSWGGADQILNSIIWENSSGSGPLIVYARESSMSIRTSLVQGTGGSGPHWDALQFGLDLGGNLDADPGLIGRIPGPGSPVIDAGDNASVPLDVLADFAGSPRFVDDPETPDTGAGRAPIVDIGAFERQASDP